MRDPFEKLLGNRQLRDELTSMLSGDRMPGALLFLGDDGCGRYTCAKMLAASYLDVPLDRIERRACPDFIEIRGQGVSNNITVDSVRKAIVESHNSAVSNEGRRVFLIKDAQNLNGPSSAALLKSLEEPLPGVVYMLTARSENDLLDTIRSRCLIFRLSPLDTDVCAREASERTGRPEEFCTELSEFFGGRLGLVLDCIRDTKILELYTAAKRFMSCYRNRDLYGMDLEANAYTERLPAIRFWEFISLFFANSGELEKHLLIESKRKDLESNVNIRLFIAGTIAALIE